MRLFDPECSDQLGDVALALMAEATARGARIKIATMVKQQADPTATMQSVSNMLVQQALGISEESAAFPTPDDVPEPTNLEHAATYDRAVAYRASGNFFAKPWGNCQPREVLAALTLTRALVAHLATLPAGSFPQLLASPEPLADSALAHAILISFKAASMKTFFQEFCPAAVTAAQVAKKKKKIKKKKIK